MTFTLTGTRQPREAGEGLTLWSYMPAARLYEAEPAFSRGGGHISEVIINFSCFLAGNSVLPEMEFKIKGNGDFL